MMTNHSCLIIKMMPKDNIYGNAVTKGFVLFNHWHTEIEFIYVDKGILMIQIDNKEFAVQEKELLIISPGVMHAFMKAEDESKIWVSRIYLSEMMAYNGAKVNFADLYTRTLLVKPSEKVIMLMKELIFADYGILNECFAVLKACEITVELLHEKQMIKNYITGKAVEESENIVKMQQFIEDYLHKDITLSMLAEYLGFSSSYCSKYIKKKTNLNFLDYVNSIRLREAENLLRTTDLNITDISFSTGFNSIQSFNRIFKKIRRVTPSEYRKSLRNKK